ncbi:glycosyltransferase 87 family protein [Arthrobacter oryzae]|uniref:Alpha-1,2-mannosyltransferase n=1 Tax=Arthrobacter oryzae TaxID=409290 RepID=A0A495EUN7_9MICC|nr:glycosyltransferase 87 family protein [Arthrobacter oryzae]RKR20670.1 alpha-1,2-mannosyltransferase [Arthrobacter oryzae]
MSVLDSDAGSARPASKPASSNRPGPKPFSSDRPGRRLPDQRLLRLSVLLAIAAVGYFIWVSLGVWAKQGLDFSVYWYGGKILNDAGAAPSGLYTGNVDWAGGPKLMFTYPPFAALIFGLLARLPEAAALTLFNSAGAVVAILTAGRAVRYWNARTDWRATFRSPGNCWAAAALVLAVLNLGPWRETLLFGQINILLMGLIAGDLLTRNPRWMRGFPGSGFLVGVAAGIKLTPLVFGLYFLVRKDWRGLGNMAAGFATTVVLGWLLRPVESLQFWLRMLPDTSRLGGAGYVDNLSLKGALLHFGVPESQVTVPWLVLSLAVAALGAGVIKAASDRGARVVAVSATALTMLLISPVSWSHHWVWVAAVFPAFAWTLRETPRRYAGMRWTMGGVLGISILVFLFSPKTIGTALGAENLDVQTPGLWIMASSAGVFCAVAILACWLVALRRESLPADIELGSEPAADRDVRAGSTL